MALTDNLIAYWKLEEASGTRVDSHSTNDLTDNNTVTQAVGLLGNAAQFTAANSEYLSRTSEASLQSGDIDFTWMVDAYLDSKSAFRIFVSKYGAAYAGDYFLDYSSSTDRFRFATFTSGGVQNTVEANNLGSPATATWYKIFGWRDNSANTLNIQVNNGTVDSVAESAAPGTNTIALQIGGNTQDSRYHDGRLDSVGFWKRVLTAGERTSLYNSGNGNEYPFSEAAVAAVVSPPILSYRHNQRVHRIPGTVNPSWPI